MPEAMAYSGALLVAGGFFITLLALLLLTQTFWASFMRPGDGAAARVSLQLRRQRRTGRMVALLALAVMAAIHALLPTRGAATPAAPAPGRVIADLPADIARLHAPRRLGMQPAPLLVVFETQMAPTGTTLRTLELDALAERNTWRVLVLQARLSPRSAPHAPVWTRHDVATLQAALDRLGARGLAEPARTVFYGHGLGGAFALEALCHLPDRAAGVMVSAALRLASSCRLSPGALSGTAVVALHGLYDPVMPYQGGRLRALRPLDAAGLEAGLDGLAGAGARVSLTPVATHHAALAPFDRAVAQATGTPLGGHIEIFVQRHTR